MEYLIITVNENQVTAARFDISGRSSTLGGAAAFALDETTTLSSAAGQIAAGVSSSLRVVLCLPPALFAQRSIDLPLKDLRKIREILPAQLQSEMALPTNEAVFEALPAAEGGFLALWARHAEIAAAIETFRSAGCEPQIVSAVPFGWNYLPGISDDCAVCDGNAFAVIRSDRFSVVRTLDGAKPDKHLAVMLSAMELSGTALPSKMFVYGEHAARFMSSTDLPLEVAVLELPEESAALFRTDETFQQLAGLYGVARACHAGELPDFRRGDLAWTTGNARVRRQLTLTAVLVSAAVILLFALKWQQYRAARTDISSLNASIATIYREIFPSRAKAVDELSEVKGEIRKLSGTENSSAVLDALRQLSEAKGSSINGLFEAEVEGRTLRVKGDARSAQGANEFKASLGGLMSAIDMGEIKSRPDGTVSFSLSGTLKETAK